MGACLTVSLTHDAYRWLTPDKPLIILSDGKGFTKPVPSVEFPIMDDTELLNWTVKAAVAPYNVDYFNYATQLNTAGRRFTVRGWNTFANSYTDQGNFEELKRARLLCHAQQTRAPTINQTSYVQGALAYEVRFPLVQTCENVNQTSTNNLMVTALVVRTNVSDHSDGLAIDQLVASTQH